MNTCWDNNNNNTTANNNIYMFVIVLKSGHCYPRIPGDVDLSGRRSPSLISVPAQQNFFEGLSEDFVEYRVKYWIDHWTGVTEPSDQIKDFMIDFLLTIGTKGR